MTYVLFLIAASVSFGMGWYWGYGHGRQVGKSLGRYEAGKAAEPTRGCCSRCVDTSRCEGGCVLLPSHTHC
ncbi:hypothetical protein GA0061099_10659 [Bradyrhizobium yuanmingense]|uniref:Uncharacterized protein n=1 Tax=Bradyrhizobium yuanmingense TaxID=108015 RepID=A0A1C3XMI4_9BRAD|nr:hypothetical protein IQ15_07043 [Bradyrhizobium yuanmingense]SCB53457.1 hypothetical protein GA0061099_10659 [Bradyrhizobium yuanmingense]